MDQTRCTSDDYADETPGSDLLAYRRLAHFSSRVTAGKKIHTLSGRGQDAEGCVTGPLFRRNSYLF